jgi:hypothetical protein
MRGALSQLSRATAETRGDTDVAVPRYGANADGQMRWWAACKEQRQGPAVAERLTARAAWLGRRGRPPAKTTELSAAAAGHRVRERSTEY